MTKEEMIVTVLYHVPGLHNWPLGSYYDVDDKKELKTGHPDFDRYCDMYYRRSWCLTNWYGKEVTEKDEENPLRVDIYLIETEPEIKFEVLELRHTKGGGHKYEHINFNLFGLLDYLESEEIKDIRNRFWGKSCYEQDKCYVNEQVVNKKLTDFFKEDKDSMPQDFLLRFENLLKDWLFTEDYKKAKDGDLDKVRENHYHQQVQLLKDYEAYKESKT